MKTKEKYYIMIWLDNENPSYTIYKPFNDWSKAAKQAVKYCKENNVMFTISTPYFREWLNTNSPKAL